MDTTSFPDNNVRKAYLKVADMSYDEIKEWLCHELVTGDTPNKCLGLPCERCPLRMMDKEEKEYDEELEVPKWMRV